MPGAIILRVRLGVKVEEVALEPQAMFYANGKWENNIIQKHSWASLILSNKSRDETLAATLKTQNTAKMAALIGGVLGPICLGVGLLIAPSPSDDGGADKPATVQTDSSKPAKKQAPAKTDSSKKSSGDSKKSSSSTKSAPASDKGGSKGSSKGGKKGKKGGKGKRR